MRILILTLSFGSGHVRAARAVAQELARRAPGAEARVCDALENCRLLFRAGYVWPYWVMVRHAPALWDRFFTARVTRMDQRTAPEWAFRFGCPKVFDLIESFKPDTIVAAEVAACEMAVIARRRGLTQARIISVITDYEAEPAWVKPEVDAFAVADQEVRAQLIEWGAPPCSIVTSGVPVDAGFGVKHEPSATLMRYSISNRLPLALLMGGGMGPTRMDQVARRLLEGGTPMNIIAITGHDSRVRRRLARLHAAPPASLRVLGWTDDVAALMQAASVLVTKPGGLTLAEAAQCALPVVVFDPIPGPERHNAARLAGAGAAVITDGVSETAAAAVSLLDDESARRAMSAGAQKLARPHAAAEIAQLALGDTPQQKTTTARRMMA